MQVWIPGTSVHSKLPVKTNRNPEQKKQISQAGATFEVATK